MFCQTLASQHLDLRSTHPCSRRGVDKYGNDCKNGGAHFTARISSVTLPSGQDTNVPVEDRGDGTYQMRLNLKAPCEVKLAIQVTREKPGPGQVNVQWFEFPIIPLSFENLKAALAAQEREKQKAAATATAGLSGEKQKAAATAPAGLSGEKQKAAATAPAGLSGEKQKAAATAPAGLSGETPPPGTDREAGAASERRPPQKLTAAKKMLVNATKDLVAGNAQRDAASGMLTIGEGAAKRSTQAFGSAEAVVGVAIAAMRTGTGIQEGVTRAQEAAAAPAFAAKEQVEEVEVLVDSPAAPA